MYRSSDHRHSAGVLQEVAEWITITMEFSGHLNFSFFGRPSKFGFIVFFFFVTAVHIYILPIWTYGVFLSAEWVSFCFNNEMFAMSVFVLYGYF